MMMSRKLTTYKFENYEKIFFRMPQKGRGCEMGGGVERAVVRERERERGNARVRGVSYYETERVRVRRKKGGQIFAN